MFRSGQLQCLLLGVFVYSTLLINPVIAEHVPANWDEMELHKWYDMIPEVEPVKNIISDPITPGRLYGLREKEDGSWLPVTSKDDGKTWLAFDDGIRTPIKRILCHHLHVVQTGPGQRQLFVIGDEREHGQMIEVMYRRQSLTSPWTEQVVGTMETNLIGVSAHSSGVVLLSTEASDGAVFLAEIRRSIDFGDTWQTVYSNTLANYYSDMSFSPFNDGTVYACGWAYDETELIKSTDWGQTWSVTNFPYNTTPLLMNVFYHPELPEAVFVTLEERFHSIPYCIKISWDGGNSWEDFGPYSDEEELKIGSVFFDPLDSSTVLVTGGYSQIWKSTDDGATWEMKLDHDMEMSFWTYDIRIREFNLTTGYWYISHDGGTWISEDRGENWYKDKPYHCSDHANCFIDLSHPEKAIFSRSNGVFTTVDGGQSWQPGIIHSLNKQMDSQLTADPADPRKLCASNSINSLLYTENFGLTWIERQGPPGSENIEFLRYSNSIPGKLFCVSENEMGKDAFVSLDDGQNWQKIEIRNDFLFNSIIDSPHDPSILCAIGMPSSGNQHTGEDNMFFRSQDNGATWVSYGSESGFTTDYPDAMTVFHPQNPNVIYSGSGLDSRITSNDLGQTWQASNLGPNGHRPFFIHPLAPNIMIDVNRFSRDGGVTFSEKSNSDFIRMSINRFDIFFRQWASQLQICRMDDVGPAIQLMGYGDSRLVVDEPSELTIYAYVVDPSEHDRISHIELFWDGMPTGFKIYPNDNNSDDSSEFISFNVPFVPTTALFSRFNWIAMDIFGNKSSPWPTFNSK